MKKIIIGAFLVSVIPTSQADTQIHSLPGVVPSGTYVDFRSSDQQPGDDVAQIDRAQDVMFVPDSGKAAPSPFCETPASLACVYNLTTQVPGCPINGTSEVAKGINNAGAGTTIGVVEQGSYEAAPDDYTKQLGDLQTYSTKFHLTQPTSSSFLIYRVNGAGDCILNGTTPGKTESVEHILDLDMLHAMAENAKIIEVEADTTSDPAKCSGPQGIPCSTPEQTDQAIACAIHLVQQAGGGFVSDSYSGPEHATETLRDSLYNKPGAILVGSSGDYSAPARYPSSSPYVISAGASSIIRDRKGKYMSQSAWNTDTAHEIFPGKSGTSGGPSKYEPRPFDQLFVQRIVGTQRGTPDFAADGDPATGPCVYASVVGGWIMSGGTSAAAPQIAGILDTSVYRVDTTTTTQQLMTRIYQNAMINYHRDWADGVIGNNGYPALIGYDFVTGLGTPRGYQGK